MRKTETRIYVGRRYGSQAVSDGSWTRWIDRTFDEVVEEVGKRVLDGKASSLGMEVIEVTVTRSVVVAPKIEAIEITEATR